MIRGGFGLLFFMPLWKDREPPFQFGTMTILNETMTKLNDKEVAYG